ncbi:MAG: RsmB/NOP family class I SAM-dependent RNA methyltransferase [Nitrososphaera sp.]
MALLFPQSPRADALARKYGYDPWLVSRFLQYVPDVERFLEKMEKKPTQYIRVNTIKTDAPSLERRLEEKGFALSPTALPEVFAVEKAPMSAGATTEYMLGHYYLQDLSSCMAVEALDVKEGQKVLDMAAAPGGKTTLIAQRMGNTGCIIALEPREKRARSMSFNLARLGVFNTCVCRMDGLDAERLGRFDRVLLDAPCSCEGVIAKDSTRKTSHAPEDVDYCSSRQEKMLEVALRVAKPGGIVVYSTCSFAPEENEAVVESVAQRLGAAVEPFGHGEQGLDSFGDRKFKTGKNTRRFYPHLHDTTGFFVARLRA